GVELTTKVRVLEGRVSLRLTGVGSRAAVALGLLMVKVNVVVPFSGMLAAGLNALLIVGGATTVRFALAWLPLPPFVEVGVTLLVLTPAVVPLTLTETEHD